MAIPPPPGPPPPPCPPPPPAMGSLKLGGPPSGGGDMRSALLQSIQKGKTLKKTVTVDKSSPAIAGKVQGEVSTTTTPKRTPQSNISTNNLANGGPKLGGIFEGLSSMPKLKPVNGTRGTPSSVRTNKNSSLSSVPQTDTISKTSPPSVSNTNGPMDFNTELTKHLTLKRQKQQINATEANLRTNRGPPPQPPTQKNISSSTSDSVLEKNNTSVRSAVNAVNNASRKPSSPTLSEGSKSNNNTSSIVKKNIANLNLSLENSSNSVNSSSSPTPPPSSTVTSSPRQSQLTPNKSTLFGGSSSGTSSNNSANIATQQITPVTGNPNKPTVNHGKPNFAPKPPAIKQIIANGQRPTVSRHHSMKSPRSPPITTADGALVYPTAQSFGTLRGPPQSFQSTEAINRYVANPPIGRPTVAPPKPPAVKPPPPPTPARSISNTNLTNLPLSVAPTNAQNNTTAHTTSINNVSSIREQIKLNNIGSTSSSTTTTAAVLSNSNSNSNSNSSNKQTSPVHNREKGTTPNGGNVPVPPLPPHRTCPAPPPPQRQLSNNNIAPVPPQRHSSMRSGPGSVVNNSPTQSSGNMSVGRLIIDLESKFANRFHNVTEFPSPPPFLSIQKSYPSRNNFTKSSNVPENRKARAPEPPGKKPSELQTFVQFTESKLCTADGLV